MQENNKSQRANFTKAKSFTETEGIPFHNFTEKTTPVILRGIPVQVSIHEVFVDLKLQDFNPISTHRMHSEMKQLPLGLLDASLDQAKEVWKVKTDCNLVVKVKKPKKIRNSSTVPTMSAVPARTEEPRTAEHRCVRYGEAHDTKVCTKKRMELPKCGYCNGLKNYRSCLAIITNVQPEIPYHTESQLKRRVSITEKPGTSGLNIKPTRTHLQIPISDDDDESS
ncbi:hypothetical protein TcasGA2_TC031018 [Tribolium castaneum]|uniref:Pre-C2HC domain-containing protein n=1 Tax=Tribolium castaneum TaxID=7070 RepID=A0A139W8G4_TRICA|nr:hypothetical protein TcasGA2_TC031018 [Tribolium castaneum]